MTPEKSTADAMSSEQAMSTQAGHAMMAQGGHLYMQTNEPHNAVVHYLRSSDGALTEVERVLTGGAGSGTFKPISGQEDAPNAFEAARSVILTPDRRFLFATNGGDNSVSSFGVGEEGKLTVLDVKRTGNLVTGQPGPFYARSVRSGTAKSLAYSPSSSTLFVLHALGSDHVRLMSVDRDGKLTPRSERYSVNTPDKPDRVATMAVLSPDERFLVIGTTFDEPAQANPDGSPILWVRRPDGELHSIASNAPDPDGLIVFPVGTDGTLGEALFQDGGGASPWYPAFLHGRPDQFIIGYAVSDGVGLASIDEHGKVTTSPVVQLDTSLGKPSELCWVAVSPDDRWVYATSFGYGYITSYRLEGNVLSIAKDPACPKVQGDGIFRALNGTTGGGPSDNWLSPDGSYLYQIYGNASKLVGYAVQADGSLEEITSVAIPHNSPQGLDGF
jgi:6-phosphogluconolactonase (cycloisomerase 2 family)